MRVGGIIASHRRRLKQLHNGRPWAQEDLAVAIGSDKAHVSRIENGRIIPSRETLIRMIAALNLSWGEETGLLTAAGYAPDLKVPKLEEILSVVGDISSDLDRADHPATLLDVIDRCWYLNPIALSFYSSAIDVTPGALVQAWVGKTILELYFDPSTHQRFSTLWSPLHIIRAIARLRKRAGIWQGAPEFQALLEQLRSYPRFSAFWNESIWQENDAKYLDYILTRINHHRVGILHFEVWRTRLSSDQRFTVCNYFPADEPARRAFSLASASLSMPEMQQRDSALLQLRRVAVA